jgi:hypothetical protein
MGLRVFIVQVAMGTARKVAPREPNVAHLSTSDWARRPLSGKVVFGTGGQLALPGPRGLPAVVLAPMSQEQVWKVLNFLGGDKRLSYRRDARWFVFQPKILIWENFSGPQIAKCWYILWPFGIFYGYLGYFMTIRYILCSLGKFFQFWYQAPRKIWQPCPIVVAFRNSYIVHICIPTYAARYVLV